MANRYGSICKTHPDANGEKASNGMCAYCKREKGREWHHANKERIAAIKKIKYAANAVNQRAKQKEDRAANPEGRREAVIRASKWRKANPEKTKVQRTKYYTTYPEKHCAKQAKHRAGKLLATPAWADKFIIQEVYLLAQMRSQVTGVEWHVDHIVPLRSNLVCGLHVETNLRVIIGKDNRIKGNKYWPLMPDIAGRSWEKVKGAAK